MSLSQQQVPPEYEANPFKSREILQRMGNYELLATHTPSSLGEGGTNLANGKRMGYASIPTVPPTGRDLIFQHHCLPQFCLYFIMDLFFRFPFKTSIP